VKCPGQYEIDLIAIDPVSFEKYHIESGVSISGSYSKLTAKPYSDEDLKIRVKAAGQRRTVGYFATRKFAAEPITETLKTYGFKEGRYTKVIVSWGWQQAAKDEADRLDIVLWDFKKTLKDIASAFNTDFRASDPL